MMILLPLPLRHLRLRQMFCCRCHFRCCHCLFRRFLRLPLDAAFSDDFQIIAAMPYIIPTTRSIQSRFSSCRRHYFHIFSLFDSELLLFSRAAYAAMPFFSLFTLLPPPDVTLFFASCTSLRFIFLIR